MKRRIGLAVTLAAVVATSATAAEPTGAGGAEYHVVVTVPAGWTADTDSKPFPRVLLMSPKMRAFDRGSAEPMKRGPDEIVCAFSRAVKKNEAGETQDKINAAVRQNFADLERTTRNERRQEVLLYTLVQHQGLVGIALVFVGLDADYFGYLYASSTFDTPLYQYKGDCIGTLSQNSPLARDIVEIIGSFRPVP
jgi:hypothetical protein